MAKKKSSSGNSANALAREMQQIAANAQIQVQQLANQATEKSFQYNSQEAATARQFNREEAKVARDWQEQQSNTAHQREVIDLKKSGLNPVLSANTGAQSYTTSSASAQNASSQANDPSGTVGQLTANLIQSRTGAYQADTSARATRAAAAQTAAATKAAAAQAASAQRYAASMAYAAQVYHSDRAKEASNYAADAKERATKYATDHAKTGTLYGILSNGLGSFGKGILQIGKGQLNSVKTIINNSDKYLKDPSKGFKASNLNIAGRQFVNKQLREWNVGRSDNVYKLYINAFLNKNASAMKKWTKYVNTYYKTRNIAANNVISRNSLFY